MITALTILLSLSIGFILGVLVNQLYISKQFVFARIVEEKRLVDSPISSKPRVVQPRTAADLERAEKIRNSILQNG